MLNWGIAEFLGVMFFMPIFPYLTFVIFDGFGIFRDAFMTSHRKAR